MFAHIDVNAFYASCETIFRPDLRNKPIVVLSNNDGVIIARSQAAKKLGIKMGQPFHELSSLFLKKNGVAVFSSNYALYGDMSNRVMQTIRSLVPTMEVYSIDEAFCDLKTLNNITHLDSFARTIKHTVQQHTHLSVSIGIAQTKTLAKLANYAAKRWTQTGGVVDLTNRNRQRKLMTLLPVSEIWGIGRQLTKLLDTLNIKTIFDLASMTPAEARKKFGVTLERTVRELNCECCIKLDEIEQKKKQVICSRSFGVKTTSMSEVREAICNYTFRAAERLREQGQYCRCVTVFLKTSIHSTKIGYVNDRASEFIPLTNDSRALIKTACQVLQRIWRNNHPYYTAGVILGDLSQHAINQFDLFNDSTSLLRTDALMKTIDRINKSKMGTIFIASQGIKRQWRMKQIYLSPAYTTRIADIPRVK